VDVRNDNIQTARQEFRCPTLLLRAKQSGDAAKVEAARRVQAELDGVLNSENHRWFPGKMPQAERDARKKAAEGFRKRYAQHQ